MGADEMMAAPFARLGWVVSIVALCAAPWAAATGSDAAATPNDTLPQAAGSRAAVVWMVFVDDLHADFSNTGRLRDLLKSIGTKLIQEGDSYGMRSSGPSRVLVDITSDRTVLASTTRNVSGNALMAADILQMTAEFPDEILSRSGIALNAARQSLDSLIDYENPDAPPAPKALVYISNGYYFDAMPSVTVTSLVPNPFGPGSDISVAMLSNVRSELASAAARAGIRIVVIDPRVAGPPMADLVDLDVWRRYRATTQDSLRPLWQQTDGFALVAHEGLVTGLTRVSTELRR